MSNFVFWDEMKAKNIVSPAYNSQYPVSYIFNNMKTTGSSTVKW